jgi:DNA-binding CsgD family transcriptional regulator
MSEQNNLSSREVEVLQLVATGLTNREIAQKLTISPNTVKVHLSNIYEKAGVSSRTEAAMYGMEHGLVDVPGGETALDQTKVTWLEGVREHLWAWVLSLLVLILLGVLGSEALQPAEAPEPAFTGEIVTRWESFPPMPEPIGGMAAVAYDGDIYAIGGEKPEGVTGQVYRFRAEGGQWEKLGDKPTPVTDVRGALLGEKIYVPGGRTSTGEPTDILEIYDPRKDLWSTGASLPKAISAYALAEYEGQIYLFGGWDGEQALNEVYVYNPTLDSWTVGTPMLTPRFNAGAGLVGGRIYVVGGKSDEGITSVNEVYTPSREGTGEDVWVTSIPSDEDLTIIGLEEVGNLIFALVQNKDDNLSISRFMVDEAQWVYSGETLLFSEPQGLTMTALTDYLYILGLQNAGGNPVGIAYKYQAIFINLLPNIEN